MRKYVAGLWLTSPLLAYIDSSSVAAQTREHPNGMLYSSTPATKTLEREGQETEQDSTLNGKDKRRKWYGKKDKTDTWPLMEYEWHRNCQKPQKN